MNKQAKERSEIPNVPSRKNYTSEMDALKEANKELLSALKAITLDLESWNLTEGDPESQKVIKQARQAITKYGVSE